MHCSETTCNILLNFEQTKCMIFNYKKLIGIEFIDQQKTQWANSNKDIMDYNYITNRHVTMTPLKDND